MLFLVKMWFRFRTARPSSVPFETKSGGKKDLGHNGEGWKKRRVWMIEIWGRTTEKKAYIGGNSEWDIFNNSIKLLS